MKTIKLKLTVKRRQNRINMWFKKYECKFRITVRRIKLKYESQYYTVYTSTSLISDIAIN